jgi:hypothetical protein
MINYNELRECGRKWPWPLSRYEYYPRICLEGMGKTVKPLRRDSTLTRFETGTSQIQVRSINA